ncbi:AT-hook motif nuclear-localized protein 9-like [Cajanus cajan]|uniref:AT-hook motif nuclear-localized protein 9-like n=1 Tax=Cajanus cajan TaxID=3821 RepID=UPI00098DBB81|nr:AT-hook motif nuclear-localized protein 9-like [Cajanus cajan]
MDQHNHTDTDQFLTLGSTSTEPEPHTPKEVLLHSGTDNDSNVVSAINVASASELAVTVASADAVGSEQPGVKRGRGRPRKNDVVGSAVSPATAPPGYSDSTARRGRGRPRGSGKLQILASIGGYIAETAGGSFIPHVLTVNHGEDMVGKIMSFFDKGHRAVCILSATGAVSTVAIRKPTDSGHGIWRYEGYFEILSLSGSSIYACTSTGPIRKTGTLSISLAKPDGSIFGGVVESTLIAACPIQLVMGTFKQNISNQIKRKQLSESSSGPIVLVNPDSERDNLKVLKLTQGEQGCPSPPTTATIDDNVFPATSNGVTDNVTPLDHNVQSASVNGGDLDCQSPQPVTDQRTSADVHASVTEL